MWQLQKKENGTYGVTIGDKEYEIKDGQIEEVEPVVNPYAENGWIKAWGYKEAGEAWSDEINDPNELKNGNYDITAKVYELNETNAYYGLVIEGKGTIKNVVKQNFDQENHEPINTGSAWQSEIKINDDGTISETIFSNKTVKVIICDGIEGIGTYMTSGEAEIAVQSSNEVSYGEFMGNKITEIVFPKSLKSIGYGSFAHCNSLTEINISKGITEIGFGAFYECTSLKQVTIVNAGSIGTYAFNSCISLKQVTIGNARSIGLQSFIYCTSLEQVTLGDVESIEDYAFGLCTNLKQVMMENVGSIGALVFYYDSNLEYVTIGNVESIASNAFNENCTNLKSITIHKPEGSVTGAKWGAPDTTEVIWDE